jgi:hypothetical protein
MRSIACRHALLLGFAALVAWPSQPAARPRERTMTLAQLGERYRRLRARVPAKPPEFDKDLRGWGGQLHRVMTELGARLGKGRHTTRTLRRIMGPADALVTARSEGFAWGAAENRAPTTVALWVYFWRGWHDYLYFEVDERGRVSKSGWWMAGD